MGKMGEHAWQEDICPLTHAWICLSKYLCHLWDQKPKNVMSRDWRHESGRFLSPQNVFTASPGSVKSAKSQVSVSQWNCDDVYHEREKWKTGGKVCLGVGRDVEKLSYATPPTGLRVTPNTWKLGKSPMGRGWGRWGGGHVAACCPAHLGTDKTPSQAEDNLATNQLLILTVSSCMEQANVSKHIEQLLWKCALWLQEITDRNGNVVVEIPKVLSEIWWARIRSHNENTQLAVSGRTREPPSQTQREDS